MDGYGHSTATYQRPCILEGMKDRFNVHSAACEFVQQVSFRGQCQTACRYKLTKEAAPEAVMLYMASADNK